MTPEEAGDRAGAEAETWIRRLLARTPKQGTMESRRWGPPGGLGTEVVVLAPVMKDGHSTRWIILGAKEVGSGNTELSPEEAVRSVREHVENAAKFAIPLLTWMSRAGFDPRDLADETIAREVMES
jgi:hypothetical protein